eukprot:snap_masked-scaffold_41-processed-gene-1.22-mRNA-1 protein AED:1.00 eAED:1.00 QI:0/-1/0/0/-1/1/1/0/74
MNSIKFYGPADGSSMGKLNEPGTIARIGRSLVRISPLVVPVGIAAAWFVFPALTPEFKASIGIGPKVEVEEDDE